VAASHFRTFHSPLGAQRDFIAALAAARDFAAAASAQLGLDVFPYSVFHVYFEQYLGVGREAAALLGGPLAAVAVAAWAFTGSAWAAGLLALTLASLLLDLLGAMWLAGIQVNAVSLVNLAMALGIAVEFCAHVLQAYLAAAGTRRQRAAAALARVGASVLSGITLTKLVGTSALAAAAPALHPPRPPAVAVTLLRVALPGRARGAPRHRRRSSVAALLPLSSRRSSPPHQNITKIENKQTNKYAGVSVLGYASTTIFRVYYFRLYVALVVLGAAHGLVLLPVLLSLIGPPMRGGPAAAAASGAAAAALPLPAARGAAQRRYVPADF